MQTPIKFLKPTRGVGSCQTIQMQINNGAAACLQATRITDITGDGNNGIVVYESGGV